jgi:hypothetical protein
MMDEEDFKMRRQLRKFTGDSDNLSSNKNGVEVFDIDLSDLKTNNYIFDQELENLDITIVEKNNLTRNFTDNGMYNE